MRPPSSEHVTGKCFPWTAAIPPCRQPRDFDVAGGEIARQSGQQQLRDIRLDLVLDGDVRAPAASILWRQQARKGVGQIAPDGDQIG